MTWIFSAVALLIMLGFYWDRTTPGGDANKSTPYQIEAERKSKANHEKSMAWIAWCARPREQCRELAPGLSGYDAFEKYWSDVNNQDVPDKSQRIQEI